MPRKCCTGFDGKPCRANYTATKLFEEEKNTVYGFPTDPNEQELWKKSLPNVLKYKCLGELSFDLQTSGL